MTRFTLLALAIALVGCGGADPAKGGNDGSCATNADCTAASICVSGTCTTLTDGGSSDAGSDVDAGPADAGVCTQQTWSNTWNTWFSNTCFGCHYGQTKSFAASGSAYSRMQSCDMPRGGPCVSAEELSAIQAWESCGAP